MICEYGICTKEATTQFQAVDEDKATYYTTRCEEHPVTDLEYVEVGL